MVKNKLKILSYNIHKGFNARKNKFILLKIREAIRIIHPDLVFLQEVIGQHEIHQKKVKDWPDQPQFEYLAHEIWPHFAYGKNAVYAYGHHGNAILSKYPLLKYENIDVSTNFLEKRGILHATLKLPGNRKPLHAFCVHFGLWETERSQQLDRLCKRIQSHVDAGDPLVIGGDFNDWRGRISPPLKNRLSITEVFDTLHGYHAKTFPCWYPAFKLDRIYVRNLKVEVARCLNDQPWNELSDHAALMAELHFE